MSESARPEATAPNQDPVLSDRQQAGTALRDAASDPHIGVDTAASSTDWRPLVIILVSTFLLILDAFIVVAAIPTIQQNLGASSAAIQWVVAGYTLMFAAFLITGGRIGDRIGRRRALVVGMSIFVVASGACGLSPNAATLVVARLAQGIGAALISPNVLSTIGVQYSGQDRVRAITAYAMVMGLGATCAQIVGGALIQANIAGSSWRAIFLINVPVGLAAILLAPRLVPESRAARAGRLDLGGVGLLTVAMAAVLVPLVEGRQFGWPWWAWVMLALAPLMCGVLASYERALVRRDQEPLLHPTVFLRSGLRAGLTVQVVCWCSQAAFFLLLAIYLQQGRGLSALGSGLFFVILSGPFVLVSMRAPSLTARFGRNLIMTGALTVATGDLALAVAIAQAGTAGNIALLAPGLVLVGVGQALWITPLTSTILAHVEPQRAGMVSGTLATMQQVGNSLGIAISGAIFFGSVGSGYSVAFIRTLLGFAALLAVAAALTRRLPSQRQTTG